MFAWIIGPLALAGIATHVLTGTSLWATLIWVLVFLIPGLILLLRTLNMQSAKGELVGPIVFGVIVLAWAVLGQQ